MSEIGAADMGIQKPPAELPAVDMKIYFFYVRLASLSYAGGGQVKPVLSCFDFADYPVRHHFGGPPFKSVLVIVRMASTVGG